MNILMLAVNDPAGTAIGFCKALAERTDHVCRLITLETRYVCNYQADIHLPDAGPEGLEEAGRLFRESDVLHFHMTADEFTPFGPFLPADHLAGKAVVHHHHGHPDFRGDPGKYREKYRERGRKNLLVSTPDLLRFLPEARWQPNLVPVGDPRYLPLEEEPAPPLRIGHTPTRKDLKNTDDLLRVAAELQAEPGLPEFSLDVAERVPHEESLARKRQSHMVFDHMQGYYGVTSLEALSLGKPTIAGLDDWNIGHILDFAGPGELPWVLARTPHDLKERLRELLADPGLRREAGRASRTFMEKRWSDALVAKRLAAFYEQLV